MCGNCGIVRVLRCVASKFVYVCFVIIIVIVVNVVLWNSK